MGGSRTGSRLQRQAKSAVSYRESDDEDEDFLPSAKPAADVAGRRNSLRNSASEESGVAKGRRSLTLKKPSRSQERATKATKEHLDVEKTEAAAQGAGIFPDHRRFSEVVDSDDDVPKLRRESSAFQYLLEIASDAGCVERGGCSAAADEATTIVHSEKAEEEGKRNLKYEQEGMDDVKGVGESKVYKRKLADVTDEESKQANSSPGKRIKDTITNEGEKNDENDESSSSEEEDEEDDGGDISWDESSDASDYEKKSTTKISSKVIAVAEKQGTPLKNTNDQGKDSKKALGKTRRVPSPAATPKNVQSLLPKKRPALWVGTKTCSSPGGTPLNVQSPSIAHRRVVGLSRRHRPPPLHPYLVGS